MSKRGVQRQRRVRRDTATPDADLLRSRFSELGLTQTEFVMGRGFTLRTFQRALAGAAIAKVFLRKIAEALSIPYEQVAVAPRHRIAGDGLPADFEFLDAEEKPSHRRSKRQLIQLASNLRLEFQRATECRRPPLTEQEFAGVKGLVEKIRSIDGDNGHAHYYAGEVKRWMGRRADSHYDFFRYLDFYQQVFVSAEEGDAGLENCYRRGHGYCCERTAWIHHLLALDLWKRGRVQRDLGALDHALKHANAALGYFPRGFVQHASTTRMRDTIELAIAKLEPS